MFSFGASARSKFKGTWMLFHPFSTASKQNSSGHRACGLNTVTILQSSSFLGNILMPVLKDSPEHKKATKGHDNNYILPFSDKARAI